MPKNDEEWILYANSKIKLNQKGVAKKALKIYLLKYNSQKVINLLNSLFVGKSFSKSFGSFCFMVYVETPIG